MEIYTIVPHVGVGPVRLGMSCAESRAAMKYPLSGSHDRKDLYHSNSFQIHFDEEERVEYIELSKVDSFKALYKGVDIHNTKADKLLKLIMQDAEFDSENPELGYSYIFPALQLSVWRSILPEDDKKRGSYFMTIGVGIEGYYSPERKEKARKELEARYPPGWAEQQLPSHILDLLKRQKR